MDWHRSNARSSPQPLSDICFEDDRFVELNELCPSVNESFDQNIELVLSNGIQLDRLKMSNEQSSASQMRGWFKLIETIRKTDSPFESESMEKVSSTSSEKSVDDEDEESPPKKRITIRKSIKSVESEVIPSNGTDLDDQERDERFLQYFDLNTLSLHFNTSLYIEKRSSPYPKQQIFKSRPNVLNKIFQMNPWKPSDMKISPSPTAETFKKDWSINRHRSARRNFFHQLQLNPRRELFSSSPSSPSPVPSPLNIERMKQILLRTYYPLLCHQLEHDHHFGAKAKFPGRIPLVKKEEIPIDSERTRGKKRKESVLTRSTRVERRLSEEIPVKQSDEVSSNSKKKLKLDSSASSDDEEENLPDQLPQPMFIRNGLRSNFYKSESTIRSTCQRSDLSARLPPIYSSLIESKDFRLPYDLFWQYEKDLLRPRPSSKEKQTRSIRWITENVYPEENSLELLRENRIAPCKFLDGLCSHRLDRIECSSSCPCGSKCANQRLRHRQWFSSLEIVHRDRLRTKSSIPSGTFLCEYLGEIRRRRSSSKSFLPLNDHWIIDASRQGNLGRYIRCVSTGGNCRLEKWIVDGLPRLAIFAARDIAPAEELTLEQFDEKSFVRNARLFLWRNRKVSEQRISQLPLFFPQKFFHSESKEKHSTSQRNLINLFYTFLRRSHFARLGRCRTELIDLHSTYAQLAQLIFILNEIFEAICHYKCPQSDLCPSNALKKCPSKEEFPLYYQMIEHPIDLSIIREKLNATEYRSYSAFETDLLLLFRNAINYCGEDSEVGQAVQQLRAYYLEQLKSDYRATLSLFDPLNFHDLPPSCFTELEQFISRSHRQEITDGIVRRCLYEMIFDIDACLPKKICKDHLIVHCRCGSFFEETILVQCYACQLWQHASCVIIEDSYRPYFCFECDPLCEENPSLCRKSNVTIPLNSAENSFSTITRADGLIIRVNECYRLSSSTDIFHVERLFSSPNGDFQAEGFFSRRPDQIVLDKGKDRKYFPNECIRCPFEHQIQSIDQFHRPCYVLDPSTFAKGKPIPEFTSELTKNDLFLCEYRLEKSGKSLTKLVKGKHPNVNTKSYCFDHHLEKLTMRRDQQQQQQLARSEFQDLPPRRFTRPRFNSNKSHADKSAHLNELISKMISSQNLQLF